MLYGHDLKYIGEGEFRLFDYNREVVRVDLGYG